jgi:radical SAM protein with 4Fe4S-binding SPASM domain
LKEFRLLEGNHYVHLTAPFKVILDITNECNLNCVFCYKGRVISFVDEERIKKIISEIKKAGASDILFAGGEPFALENPFWIFNYAKELGLGVGIISNGSLITEELIEKLPSNVDITISFHAPNEEKYFEITGMSGVFENTVNGLRALNNLDIKPGILYTPTQLNKNSLFDTVQYLIENKIDFSCLQLNRLIPEGSACQNWEQLKINFLEYKNLLDQMIRIKQFWPDVRVEVGDAVPYCSFEEKYYEFFVRCDYGITLVAIDEFGNVKRCPCKKENAGNVLEEPLQKIWQESPQLVDYRNMLYFPDICKDCNLLEACGGGCMCSQFNQTTVGDSFLDFADFTNLIERKSIDTGFNKLKASTIPERPRLKTNYLIRPEMDKFLCVPLGNHEVFLDNIVPKNCIFPALWLDKFEKDVLLLLNGTNTLQSISAIVNNNSELDPKKCHSKVLKVIQSFMEFNYVEACSDLSYV